MFIIENLENVEKYKEVINVYPQLLFILCCIYLPHINNKYII